MPRKHHIDNHSVLHDSPRQDVVRESNLCYLQCFFIHLANSISLRVVYLHTNCMAQWHRQESGSLLVSRRCYCASIPSGGWRREISQRKLSGLAENDRQCVGVHRLLIDYKFSVSVTSRGGSGWGLLSMELPGDE